MNAAQLERLQEQMAKLRLTKSRERLEALLQDAVAKELSYADFLDQLLTEEIVSMTAKNVSMRTNLARFPFVKSLEPERHTCALWHDNYQMTDVYRGSLQVCYFEYRVCKRRNRADVWL